LESTKEKRKGKRAPLIIRVVEIVFPRKGGESNDKVRKKRNPSGGKVRPTATNTKGKTTPPRG